MRRSLICCDEDVISTADTRIENLAPVFCFCSLTARYSQVMAQGITPRVDVDSDDPIIVLVFPGNRENETKI